MRRPPHSSGYDDRPGAVGQSVARAGAVRVREVAAEDVSASYLGKALFLAETMATPPSAALIIAKRECVFEQLSHTASEQANADFHGMRLWLAIAAIANMNGSLPLRHRFSETVMNAATSRITAMFGGKSPATQALTAFLRTHSDERDPFVTERRMRDAIADSLSRASRSRRAI